MKTPFQAVGYLWGLVAAFFFGVGIWEFLRCVNPYGADVPIEKCFVILALFAGLTVICAVAAVLLGRAGK